MSLANLLLPVQGHPDLLCIAEELRREHFEKCIGILQEAAGVTLNNDVVTAYWAALRERMKGKSRWDKVSPLVKEESSPDWQRQAHFSQ